MKNAFAVVLVLLAGCGTQTGDNGVEVIYDTDNPAIAFAAGKVEATLAARGLKGGPDRIVITLEGDPALPQGLELPELGVQGYALRKVEGEYWIIGGDSPGAMYGGLDLADDLLATQPFANIEDVDRNPYIKKRGLKFNIPLDARTPSYSDNNIVSQGNIPHMWDMAFWHEFLDEMALNRLNLLTVWSLAPFPSMVRIPDYPEIGLDDVKRTTLPVDTWGHSSNGSQNVTPEILANLETVKSITLDEKIEFWREVMQYAHDRGVEVYIYTWNIFVFGTEGTSYGITDDIDNPVTRDYVRKATKALLETYPLLAGMGVTAGEHMSHDNDRDDEYLFATYGQGVNDALEADPERTFTLVHRLGDETSAKKAFAGLNPRVKLGFAHKYSKAHVYSSTDPYWIHDHQFLEKIGPDAPFFVTVRDDSHNYLRGGSDPAFVREYVQNIPNRETNLQGFQLGPDSIVWGREFVSREPLEQRQLMLAKRWYSMRQWGKLAYDPSVPDSEFADLLVARFPGVDAQGLFMAWASASKVLPLVNRFHNHKAYLDYQWNPELCDSRAGYNSETGFHDMDTFLRILVQPHEGLIGIPDYVAGERNGTTPFDVAEQLMDASRVTLAALDGLGAESDDGSELARTLTDIRALGWLGSYYSHKVSASTHYGFFKENGSEEHKQAALADLKEASRDWWRYSHLVSSQYQPMWYGRLRKNIDILDIQAHVDKEITDLGGEVPERPALHE